MGSPRPLATFVSRALGARLAFAFLVLASLTVRTSAHAQDAPFLYGAARVGEHHAPRASRAIAFDLSLDLGVFADTVLFVTERPVRSIAGGLSARARIGPIGVEIDLPAQQSQMEIATWPQLDPNAFAPPYTASHASIGNVNVSVFGVGDVDLGRARLTLRAGLGLAGPSITPPDRWRTCTTCQIPVEEVMAFERGLVNAGAQSGQWQDYRFSVGYGDVWTPFLPFGAEMWIDRIGYMAVDGILSMHIGHAGLVSADLAAAVEGGVEPLPFVRVSLRITGFGELARARDMVSWYGLPLSTDDFQLSAEPRVTLASGPVFVRLGFLVNLDQPWGLVEPRASIITYPVWSARGSFGIRF